MKFSFLLFLFSIIFFEQSILGQNSFANDYPYNDSLKTGVRKVYFENGKLKSIESFENGKLEGEAKEYFDNGNIKSEVFYKNDLPHNGFKTYFNNGQLHEKGTFVNGKLTGKGITYTKEGKIKVQCYFKKGLEDSLFIENSENGKPYRIGFYKLGKKNGQWKKYDSNGNLSSIENYKNDTATGIWTKYYENGQIELKSRYVNNILIEIISHYEKDGTPSDYKTLDKNFRDVVYNVADDPKIPASEKARIKKQNSSKIQVNETVKEVMPTTPISDDKIYDSSELEVNAEFTGGGNEEMQNFISKNLVYPESAKQTGKAGKVLVKFIVEKDGSLSNINILKGKDLALDNEALRIIKIMPKWKPGKISGKTVRVQMTIPVAFKLD